MQELIICFFALVVVPAVVVFGPAIADKIVDWLEGDLQ